MARTSDTNDIRETTANPRLQRTAQASPLSRQVVRRHLKWSSYTQEDPDDKDKMGLRWWREVLILSQPKRYLDDRQARKYWLVSFRKIR